MIEKIKNNRFLEYIFVFLVFLIPISLCSIFSVLEVGDELWNFQNIYKMANGATIYNDCNVIITPLFFYIGVGFCKIFGDTILSFRIYNIILYEFFFLTIYTLFRAIKKDLRKNLIFTIIISIIYIPLTIDGASYNILGITMYLIGIILNIEDKKVKNYSICQGVIIFLLFYTKQTLMVYYVLGLIIINFIFYKKDGFIKLVKYAIITISLILISLIIFAIQGNLYSFIDYTILGISEFKNSNTIISSDGRFGIILYLVLDIIVNCFTVFYYRKSNKNYIKLSILNLCLIGFCFPIINFYHVVLASISSIILMLVIIDDKIVFSNSSLNLIGIMCSIIILIIGCGSVYKSKDYVSIEYSVFKGAYFTKEEAEEIKYIVKYIDDSERNVIVLSNKAALYMLPLNRNNSDFDLIHYGNLGKSGYKGLIEQIKNFDNTKILISDKYTYWQETSEVKRFVKENWICTGKVGEYQVFEKED